MKLNLKNPLIFFDLETTGVDFMEDRIVEICYIKVYPNGNEESKTIRVNPDMHIPEASTAVHGITDEDVKNEPKFKEIAKNIANVFEGCDIAGFNSNRFDIPLLSEEFARAGINFDFTKHKFIDVQTIFHKMEQRTLSAAYKFYCGKNLDDAHSADGDTLATYEVLKAQLDRYPTLKNDVEFLSDFSTQKKTADLAGRIAFDDNNVPVFNFGKYKGKKVVDVFKDEPSYYSWMMQSKFPSNTKDVITRIYMSLYPNVKIKQ
ncbi:MAG: 3'-5' exonuclease [Muribaculaceae bacterium]|jgi:DNA polymerase-3 subunit epsilon|nr:3'-5' exonuclease [Muribaculaceae bacterium]